MNIEFRALNAEPELQHILEFPPGAWGSSPALLSRNDHTLFDFYFYL
jgi:hypothetical protein